ncbi:MAG: VWA domain-containing protein [Bryobacteraceae bacterium]|jgi:VWFA-related protein
MVARIPFALALAALALAQSDKPAKPIKVQVNEVIVPVTVTDDKGRFVSNLEARDFKVYDQGKEQRIEFFSRDRNQPVVVGFLVDLSNNARIHWKNYQDAAIELVLNLLPGDKKYSGYLISYANEPELQVNTTTDSDKLVEKLSKMRPGGGSSLYDAIYMACMRRQLVEGEPYDPRRVLIVIGDGHDNASKKSLDEVIEIAQRNMVTIYGMSTVSFGFTTEGDENLLRLCSETGGRVVYPLNDLYSDVDGYLSHPSDDGNYALTIGMGAYASEVSAGIFHAIAAIAGEVTTQYILRYVPDTGPANTKQFRSIKIVVPQLPLARVRFRKGYYPFAP